MLEQLLGQCSCALSQTAVAGALGTVGDSRAVGPLLAMLREPGASDRERAWAAQGLGLLAEKGALPFVSDLSTDINYRARTESLTGPERGGILDYR